MSYSVDEVQFLSQHREQIADCAATFGLDRASAFKDAAQARERFGEYGRAVIELLATRSSGKLPQHWLMCHESAQQATPLEVAQVRAERLQQAFGTALVHDVTCSIGTEGAAITGLGMDYVGSDLDLPRLIMARENVPAAMFARADALRPCTVGADVVVADPARRAGGRRITKVEDLLPPLPALIDAWEGSELAIKCAPGMDFSEWDGLVSVVSLDGGVKEACLYTPGIAHSAAGGSVTREAVMVRRQALHGTHVDRLDDSLPAEADVAAPGSFIIEPDGAIIRAGLVQHYACREGLWMLDPHIAFLSGNAIPSGTSGFPLHRGSAHEAAEEDAAGARLRQPGDPGARCERGPRPTAQEA